MPRSKGSSRSRVGLLDRMIAQPRSGHDPTLHRRAPERVTVVSADGTRIQFARLSSGARGRGEKARHIGHRRRGTVPSLAEHPRARSRQDHARPGGGARQLHASHVSATAARRVTTTLHQNLNPIIWRTRSQRTYVRARTGDRGIVMEVSRSFVSVAVVLMASCGQEMPSDSTAPIEHSSSDLARRPAATIDDIGVETGMPRPPPGRRRVRAPDRHAVAGWRAALHRRGPRLRREGDVPSPRAPATRSSTRRAPWCFRTTSTASRRVTRTPARAATACPSSAAAVTSRPTRSSPASGSTSSPSITTTRFRRAAPSTRKGSSPRCRPSPTHRLTLGMNGSGFIEMLARQMTRDLQRMRNRLAGRVGHARHQGGLLRSSLPQRRRGMGHLAGRGPAGASARDRRTGRPSDARSSALPPGRHRRLDPRVHQQRLQPPPRHPEHRALRRRRGSGRRRLRRRAARADVTAVDRLPGGPRRARAASSRTIRVLEDAVLVGERAFGEIGCTSCHVRSLPLDDEGWMFVEPNPFNPSPPNLQPGDAPDFVVDLTSNAVAGAAARSRERASCTFRPSPISSSTTSPADPTIPTVIRST